MNRTLILWIAISPWLFITTAVGQSEWPQFRGPQGTGVSNSQPPTHWDHATGDNIQWKTPVEGLGHSSPIVIGDLVIITTAINSETDEPTLQIGWLGGTGEPADDDGDWTWQVLAFHRQSGEPVWTREVASGVPTIKRHVKASHANCTCATDGERIIAFFGSEGLFCLDLEGNILWERDFGRLHSGPFQDEELEWGFASSPVIFEDKVILQCDCLNTAFIRVLDIFTGEDILNIERDDVATWSTPLVFRVNGRAQIVCNGYKQMAGFDLVTGDQFWGLSGGGDVPVPTPLFVDDVILLTNGHGRKPTYAIDPMAMGDLTPELGSEDLPKGLKWWNPKGGSYMPTPIVVGDLLYTCDDNGILSVHEVADGELVYQERVGSGEFSASAIATPDYLFFSQENGDIHVVRTGREFEQVSTNSLEETTMATPAISNDQIFVRSVNHLICIGRTASQ